MDDHDKGQAATEVAEVLYKVHLDNMETRF